MTELSIRHPLAFSFPVYGLPTYSTKPQQIRNSPTVSFSERKQFSGLFPKFCLKLLASVLEM